MTQTNLDRVLVWSPLLRLTHWLTALAVITLLATGMLAEQVPIFYDDMRYYHYSSGYILIASSALRFYLLLFSQGPNHWRDFLPSGPQLKAAAAMLRFYISFGRAPLPRWYAHNPLWGPLYLLLFILLVLQIISGFLLNTDTHLANINIDNIHQSLAQIIGAFALFHVLAVFLHDLKGTGSDISGMISGYRIFSTLSKNNTQTISLNNINKKISDKK